MSIAQRNMDLRMAAAQAVSRLSDLYQGAVPWRAISQGFRFRGRHVHFASRVIGIFKPRDMDEVLSIKTTIPRAGHPPRYVDQMQAHAAEGALAYDMQDRDPSHPNNLLLRQAYRERIPLIYLQGIVPGLYCPHFPVYVTDWDPGMGTTRIAMGLPCTDRKDLVLPAAEQRSYTYRLLQKRVFQAKFRNDLLEAYGERCALTGLARPELIAAAHILPPAEGEESVASDGLCMSRLHHTAFNAHLIGVDPEGQIHVAQRLREAWANPFLQTGFHDLAGKRIALPRDPVLHPDANKLERRFAQFQALDTPARGAS